MRQLQRSSSNRDIRNLTITKKVQEVISDSYSDAMDVALHSLAPRARSRAEIISLLIKRGFASEICDAVLDSLELQGLLNDLEFAHLWSESRQRQKKLSRRSIASELRTKGVAQDIIEEVTLTIDDESEYRLALELAEKKYRSCAHLEYDVIYRRVGGALARKGFSQGLMARILADLGVSQRR